MHMIKEEPGAHAGVHDASVESYVGLLAEFPGHLAPERADDYRHQRPARHAGLVECLERAL
jgi:hypothetical protein